MVFSKLLFIIFDDKCVYQIFFHSNDFILLEQDSGFFNLNARRSFFYMSNSVLFPKLSSYV